VLDLKNIGGPGDAVLTVGMLAFGLIVGSYPAIKMFHWYMDGGIEGIHAAIAIMLYVVLLISVTIVPAPLAIAILAIIFLSAVMSPVLEKLHEDSQHKKIYDERMASYARALEENPHNHAARMALAETLHRQGKLDQAIEHMEWVLGQSPALGFRIKPQLDGWKREKERIGQAKAIICHLCSAENHPESTYCSECGAQFGTRAGVKQSIWRDGGPKVIIRAWITTAVTLILACFLLMTLDSIIAGPIIVAMVIVGAWLFLRWAGGDMGTIGN
jgi:hypothetical protein